MFKGFMEKAKEKMSERVRDTNFGDVKEKFSTNVSNLQNSEMF